MDKFIIKQEPKAETRPMPVTNWQRIDLDKECWLMQRALPPEVALDSQGFKSLWDMQPLEPGKVLIYGQLVETPRKQQAYEKPYWFSGLLHEPNPEYPTPEACSRLQAWIRGGAFMDQELLRSYEFDPNEILVNWYGNGNNYIGPHSDDESQLKLTENGESLICTISYGATRKFRIRRKMDNAIVRDLELSNNTITLMGGKMQKLYRHEIVKVNGQKGLAIGPRISVTIRHFIEQNK